MKFKYWQLKAEKRDALLASGLKITSSYRKIETKISLNKYILRLENLFQGIEIGREKFQSGLIWLSINSIAI